MACYYKKRAWQREDGLVVFSEKACRGKPLREIGLPCGKCIGCRVRKNMSWGMRMMHEAQMHESNAFVTLTYDDENAKASIHYRDFQLFMKRLRKKQKVRFFVAGEYGEDKSRAHFHACLFGASFPNNGMVGKNIYRSESLEKLWPHGFSSVGEVNITTARYVASYVINKRDPVGEYEDYYKRVNVSTGEIIDVVPEFGRMSLRPGIGANWFAKYWRDVYAARSAVVVKGKELPAPRYYRDRFDGMANACTFGGVFPMSKLALDEEYRRYVSMESFKLEDETPERLRDRELVDLGKVNFYKSKKL